MKKPYQIESQRAVKRFEEMVGEGTPELQMVLPMAEMVGWLRKGVGELIRQAGPWSHQKGWPRLGKERRQRALH